MNISSNHMKWFSGYFLDVKGIGEQIHNRKM